MNARTYIKNTVASVALIGAIAIGINVANAAILPESSPKATGANTSTSANAIDTSNREAVRQRFLNDYLANDRHFSPNNGADVAKCEAGLVNPVAARSVVKVLNYFRGMAGVDAVSVDTAANNAMYTQAAALNMAANNRLTHQVPENSKCYSKAARSGAQVSNLAQSRGQTSAEQVLWYFMDWSGNAGSTMSKDGLNDQLGHRLRLLDPFLHKTSYGNVGGFNALSVSTHSFEDDVDHHEIYDTGSSNPETFAWPSAGYFPYQLLTAHKKDQQDVERWSFSIRNADVSQAKVTLVGPDGKQIPVRLVANRSGNGIHKNVVFKFPALKQLPVNTWSTQDYRVTISGIKGAAKSTYTYTVKLFDPMVTNNGTAPKIKVLETPKAVQGGLPLAGHFQVTGDAGMKYQWQRSTDGGKTWHDIKDKYSEQLLNPYSNLPTTLRYAPTSGTCFKYGAYVPCSIKNRAEAERLSFRLRVSNRAGTTYSSVMKLEYYGFNKDQIERQGNTLQAQVDFAGNGDSVYSSRVIKWVDQNGTVLGTGENLTLTAQMKGKQIHAETEVGVANYYNNLRYEIKLPAVQV